MRTMRTLSTVLTATLIAIFAIGFVPYGNAHAQAKPPATTAAPVQPANPAPVQGNPAAANPAPANQPANPAQAQPATSPIGGMFLKSNSHLRVCKVDNPTNKGGKGQVDLDALFTSIGENRADIWALWLVPADDVVTFDDLSRLMGESATVDRDNVPNLNNLLDVPSGNFHMVIQPAGLPQAAQPLWLLGIVRVEDGAIITELSATYPDCDLVEPEKPAADASSTAKPLPKAGNLALAIYATENRKPLAGIAVLLLGLGVMGTGSVLGIRRERRLAAATPDRFRAPRR